MFGLRRNAVPLLDPRANRPLIISCRCRSFREQALRTVGSAIELVFQFLNLPLALLCLLLARLVLAAVVVRRLVDNEAHRDPADEEEPEKVDSLQTGQQCKADDLRNPALVLLGFPVEFKGADGFELVEDGEEDLEVEVVAQIGPDAHEEEEVGPDE
jgi:hypothetical protein